MNDIICQGKLTQKDFVKFIVLSRRKELVIQSLLLWGAVYFFLYALNGYLYLRFETSLILLFSVVTTGVISFLFIIALWFQAKKKYKVDNVSKKLHTYFINEHKINQRREIEQNEYTWEDVYKVVKGTNIFLIYISRKKAIVLPFHFFKSENDIQLVRKIIDSRYKI